MKGDRLKRSGGHENWKPWNAGLLFFYTLSLIYCKNNIMLKEPILTFVCIAGIIACSIGLSFSDDLLPKILFAVSLSGISYFLGALTHCGRDW